MKALIIYASRTGVSRHCCEILCERLCPTFECECCDISKNPPSPEGFDAVVIGGSIRMSRLDKRLKAYMRLHASALSRIPCAVFICCGYTESFEDYVHFQVPKALTPSLGFHCFGGELKPDRLHGFDKLVVKRMRASIVEEDFESPNPESSPLPEIVPENIWRLADSIRNLL